MAEDKDTPEAGRPAAETSAGQPGANDASSKSAPSSAPRGRADAGSDAHRGDPIAEKSTENADQAAAQVLRAAATHQWASRPIDRPAAELSALTMSGDAEEDASETAGAADAGADTAEAARATGATVTEGSEAAHGASDALRDGAEETEEEEEEGLSDLDTVELASFQEVRAEFDGAAQNDGPNEFVGVDPSDQEEPLEERVDPGVAASEPETAAPVAAPAAGRSGPDRPEIDPVPENAAPQGFSVSPLYAAIPESVDLSAPLRVATFEFRDDGLGDNRFTLGGADADNFEIRDSGVYLKAGVALDFETQPSFDLTITVADASLGFSETLPLTLSVGDVNDVAPEFVSATVASALESVTEGVTLYTAAATDADGTGEALSFSLTDDAGGLLQIDAATGAVSLASGQALDAESLGTHQFTVRVSDGTHHTDQTVTLSVGDVNDVAPEFVSATVASALESVTEGVTLYTAAATDADGTGEALSFSLTDDAGGLLQIDAATGAVSLASGQALDAENLGTHQFTVRVSDGTHHTDQTVTLSVGDVNDVAPEFVSATVASALESVAEGVTLYTAAATDADGTGEALSFSLTDDAGGLLQIDAATGAVSLASGQALDAESLGTHQFTVRVSDGTHHTDQTVTLSVGDVNDVAPEFVSATVASALESVTEGVTLYTAAATDADGTGEALSFSLTDDAGGLLQIDAATGAVSLASGQALDAESLGTHQFTVRVSDGTHHTDQTVTLSVGDVNDVAPEFVSATVASALESVTEGVTLYTAAATDADGTGEALSFSLTDDAGGLLQIDAATGAVSLASGQALDAESLGTHQFTVRVSDGTHHVDQTVTLSVGDVNDVAPEFVSATVASALESVTEGVTLYTAAATDADGTGEALSFSLTDDAGGLLQIDAATGAVSLASGQALDAESLGTHQFTVRVSDGTHHTDQTVTLSVGDVNDVAPEFVSATVASALESVTEGVTLYTAAATDADGTGEALSFSLTDDAGGLLQIDAATGAVSLASGQALDAENLGTHQFTVRVSDGTHHTDQTVTLSVGDVNDVAPEFVSATVASALESVAEGVTLYTAAATDADGTGEALSFSLTDDAGGLLQIDAATGAVSLASGQALDAESLGTHQFTVRVSDGTHHTDQTVTLSVGDVNDVAPEFVSATVASALESVTEGVTLYTAAATDADGTGEALSFSLTDDAGGLLQIDAATGAVSLASGQALDAESLGTHQFTVRVSDGTHHTDQTVTLSVGDVNDVAPEFVSATVASALESVTEGVTLYTAAATDADGTGEALSFSLTDDAGGLLQIDAATGAVSLASGQALDAENLGTHQFTVRVSDGTHHTDQTVTLSVGDVNDVAPEFVSATVASALESVAEGVTLYTAAATDADGTGEALSFSLTDDAGGLLQIDAATGAVSLASGQALDAESLGTHQFTVRVSDGTHHTDQTVTLSVGDVNDVAPEFVSATVASALESVTEGVTLYTAAATDADGTGEALSFSLTDDAGGLLQIDAATGAVSLASGQALDAESLGTHQFTVRVSDGTHHTDQTVTLSVGDVNDVAPEFVSATVASALESVTEGVTLYTAAATDADGTGEALSFSLTDDAGGLLQIDAATGAVSLASGQALDAESLGTHQFTVRVSDGTHHTDQTVTLSVGDVNDVAPEFVSATVASALESVTEGVTLYTAAATDADGTGEALSFSLTDDAGGLLQIDAATGAVSLASGQALDAESLGTHQFTVRVSDGTHHVDQTVTLSVGDVNDVAPEFVSATVASALESVTEGVTLYTAAATDADGTGEALSFSLTDDAGGLLQIDAATGAVSLASGQALDAESLGTHQFTVRVSDGTHHTDQTVTLSVGDVNDVAPEITSSALGHEISEGALLGAQVLTVTAADPDLGDTVTFSLTADAGGAFTIDAETGVVSIAAPNLIDFELSDTLSIVVEARDAAGHATTQGIDISVSDVLNEVLTGGDLGEILLGGLGDDSVVGGAGDDSISGGFGDDTLVGLGGDDTLVGGSGDDSIVGGEGDGDVAVFDGDLSDYEITYDGATDSFTLVDPGLLSDETDIVSGVESFQFADQTVSAADLRDGAEQTLVGGGDDDVLTGGGADDSLDGGDGADTLTAGAGDDTLLGGDGDDLLQGDVGNDVLLGEAGADTLEGGADDDTLTGGAGDDSLDGGTGADTAVFAGDQSDYEISYDAVTGTFTISDQVGTDGTDTVTGVESFEFNGTTVAAADLQDAADQSATGGSGDDALTGGAGDDALDGGAGADTLTGAGGSDTLTGGTGSDQLSGGEGADSLDGGAEADTLAAGAGDDTLLGGDGDDLLQGDAGNDVLQGEAGADTLEGGADDDTLTGGSGDDSLDGGTGADTAVFAGDQSDYEISYDAVTGAFTISDQVGTDGTDTVTGVESFEFNGATVAAADLQDAADQSATGGSGDDTLTGGTGDDTIDGGDGADVIEGGDGNDSLDGGAGDDTINYGAGDDTVYGGDGDDFIDDVVGARLEGDNALYGGAGNDTIYGGLGHDSLYGEAGNDRLYGEEHDDYLVGGEGDDQLRGEGGTDTAVYAGDRADYAVSYDAATGALTITDLVGTDGTDTVRDVEIFDFNGTQISVADLIASADQSQTGGTGDDALTGGAGDDALDGGAGADTLTGAGGDDTLTGGEGSDQLSGGEGADSLDGGAGADTLTAGAGDDTLLGGDGDDLLQGDAGNDVLQGEAGADTLEGGADDDTLTGGAGDDSLDGGAGDDTAVFSGDRSDYEITYDSDTGAYTISDQVGTDGTDTVTGVETFEFNGATLTAAELRDLADQTLTGGSGDDALTGGAGDDTLVGGEGDDTLSGGGGNDVLEGGAGDDVIDGGLSAIGEAGTVTVSQTSADEWHSVSFDGAIENAVVVMTANSLNDANPFSIRVRNVTDDGFEFQIDEWDYLDGAHGLETLSWMAIEEGVHTLDNGLVIEAGVADASSSETSVDFTASFDGAPVVLAQIESVNDAAAAADRMRNIDQDGFDLSLEGEETGASHGTEQVGWIAIDTSGVSIDGAYVGVTANAVDHGQTQVTFDQTFDEAPVVLADMQTTDGGDTSTTAATDVTASGVNVSIEEEQSNDSETSHTSEVVGVFALEEGALYAEGEVVARYDGAFEDFEIGYDSETDSFTITDLNAADGLDEGSDTVTGVTSFEFDGVAYDYDAMRDAAVETTVGEGGEIAATGGDGANEIAGGDADDTLSGQGGDDTLSGGAGDDVLDGGDGADSLAGGDGSDSLSGGDGADSLYGNDGDDTLDGGAGDDYLEGGAGYDVLIGGGETGPVTFYATDFENNASDWGGSDVETAAGDGSTMLGGWDNGDARDTQLAEKSVSGIAEGDEISVSFDHYRIDGIDSNEGLAVYVGDEVAFRIYENGRVVDVDPSLAADISVVQTGSANYADLQRTNNTDERFEVSFKTTVGADFKIGFGHNLSGGDESVAVDNLSIDGFGSIDGDDTLVGGAGDDTLDGGAGTGDVAVFSGEQADYTITYDQDADTFTVVDNGGNGDGTDLVTGVEIFQFADGQVDAADLMGPFDQTIAGEEGDDALTGEDGADTISGGEGADTLSGAAGDDSLSGGGGADSLLGGDGDDVLEGGAGSDTLAGGADDDALLGGADGDSLSGGAGDDTLAGGDGDDVIDGGADADTAVFSGNRADYDVAYDADADVFTVTDLAGAGGTDTVTGVESFEFADQTLTAAELQASADQTLAGDGTDDTLTGGSGDDAISGGAGADALDGAAGADTLTGGEGDDTLTGGEGDDAAVFSGDQSDYDIAYDDVTGAFTITDVDAADGDDGTDVVTGVESYQFADQTLTAAELQNLADQTLTGDETDEALTGGTGDDAISGAGGADTLTGGVGADTLTGGAGDDSLIGGGGAKFSYEYYDLSGDTADLAAAGFDANGDNANPADGVGFVDSLDEDGIPGAHGGDLEYFALKFTSQLSITSGGDYTFDVTGDDGVKLFIDGVEVVDHDGLHGTSTLSGSVSLEAGVHTVEIIYFENWGEQNLSVAMSGPDTGGLAVDFDSLDALTADNGDDTAMFSGDQSNYAISYDAATETFTISDLVGTDGTDTVTGVESFNFNGTTVSAADLQAAVDQTITGDDDAETISGGAGDDTLSGLGGADTISGGEGADRISGGSGADELSGGAGDDDIDGGVNGDTLSGDAGDDTLSGGAGADQLSGGADDDVLEGGSGDDALDGGTGSDTAVFAGDQADYEISYDAATQTFTISDQVGTDGTDTVTGVESFSFNGATVSAADLQDAADQTVSGDGAVGGGAGDDSISGGGGADTLTGGDGADTLSGGEGNDAILFGDGDDTVYGGAGDDYIDDQDGVILGGSDALYGEAGNDTIFAGAGDDTIDGGADDDWIHGEDDADQISGGAGADTLYGGSGDDTLTGGAGDDALSGGSGTDVATYAGAQAEYRVTDNGDGTYSVRDLNAADGDEGTDTLSEIEQIQFADSGGPVAIESLVASDPTDIEITPDYALGTHEAVADPSGAESFSISSLVSGGADDAADASGAFQITWDATGFTLTATVSDDVVVNDSASGSLWDDDSIEIYLDFLNDGGATYGADDFQFVVGQGTDNIDLHRDGALQGDPAGISSQTSATADGYQVTFSATWAGLGVAAPTDGDSIGFGVGLNDDDGAGREAQLMWDTDQSDLWTTPEAFGTLTFSDGTASVSEGATAGTVVAAAGAVDADGTSDIVYSLADDAGGAFAIDAATGEITVADPSAIDYETATTLDIEVVATDANGLGASHSETVTINVADVGGQNLTGDADANTLTGGDEGDTIAGGAGADMISGGGGDDVLSTGDGDTTVTVLYQTDFESGASDWSGTAATTASFDGSSVLGGIGDDYADNTQLVSTTLDGLEDGQSLSVSFDHYRIDGIDAADYFEVYVDGQVAFVIGEDGAVSDVDATLAQNIEVTFEESAQMGSLFASYGDDRFSVSFDAETSGSDFELGFGKHTTWTDEGFAVDDLAISTEVSAVDTVSGGDGDDTITGGGDRDLLSGDAGDDSLSGGAGDDTLSGGAGSDNVDGGDGDADVAVFDGSAADFVATLYGAGVQVTDRETGDVDTVMNVEQLEFSEGRFVMELGTSGSDVITGGSDDEAIIGGDGSDNLSAGDGSDIIFGGDGSDILSGQGGADFLIGGFGADNMSGGDGDDVFLIGTGEGGDVIDGGAGATWTDTIELEMSGTKSSSTSDSFDAGDWTVTLSSGTIESEGDQELVFSEDAAGTITFDDGTESVTFSNIETMTWNG